MMTLWRDFRFSLRTLSRHWTFTLAAVVALGLGIGATATIFSFVRPFVIGLPMVEDQDRLVFVWSRNPARGTDKSVVSLPDYVDWRDENRTFTGLAAAQSFTFNLTGSAQPIRVSASGVTGNYFSLLGVTPSLGRAFGEPEDRAEPPRVVVLSHGLWQRAFGADPGVLGQEIRLDGAPATIVGIMPQGFEITSGDLWVPLATIADLRGGDRGQRGAFVLGRLRDGVTRERATVDLSGIAARLEEAHPATNAGWSVNPVPFSEEVIGPEFRLVLMLLSLSVLLVLLIACVNVANLLLARSVERRPELALRTALGASPGRLAAQLLTESATLGLLGGVCGLVLAFAGTRLFRVVFPVEFPLIDAVGVDGAVLSFTLATSLATGLVFGLVPAWRATRPDLRTLLDEGGRDAGGARSWFRHALVATEVAFALVLLVVTGLLLQTIIGLERIPTGFDEQNLLTLSVSLPETEYPQPEQAVAFFASVLDRVETVPGVVSAGAATRLPMAGSRNNPIRSFEIEGRSAVPSSESPWAIDLVVTPGYLETLGLPLRSGRHLSARDSADAQLVAVVSDTLATRYWGDESPVGARFTLGASGNDTDSDRRWVSIVGVIGDVRNDDADQPPLPQVYLPAAQNPRYAMSLLVRTTEAPLTRAAAVQRQVWAVDADQPVHEVRTMEQIVYEDTAGSRILVGILGVFAAIALLLTIVGIYGVVSYATLRRTREVGIRMALGAGRREVYQLLIGQGMFPVMVGLVLGGAASLALARLVASVLYQVSPADPLTFGSVMLLLAAMAFLASLIPAARATRIDPLQALRDE